MHWPAGTAGGKGVRDFPEDGTGNSDAFLKMGESIRDYSKDEICKTGTGERIRDGG